MPGELERALAASGLSPEEQQAYLMAIMSQPMDPFYGSTGFDVGDANKLVDYGRDFNTLLADNMTAALAGPSAFDPASFEPTIEREYVDAPGWMQLTNLASAKRGTLDRWLAEHVLAGTQMPSILAEARNIVNFEQSDPELQQVQQALKTYQFVDDFGEPVAGRFDFSPLESLASKLTEQKAMMPPQAIAPDPATGEWIVNTPKYKYDEETGQYYIDKEVPSPQAEWFNERGLTPPNMAYELSDFSPEGGQYQAQAAMLQELLNASAGDYGALQSAEADAYKTMMAKQGPGDELRQSMLDETRMRSLGDFALAYNQRRNMTPVGRPEAPPPSGVIPQSAVKGTGKQGFDAVEDILGTGKTVTDPIELQRLANLRGMAEMRGETPTASQAAEQFAYGQALGGDMETWQEMNGDTSRMGKTGFTPVGQDSARKAGIRDQSKVTPFNDAIQQAAAADLAYRMAVKKRAAMGVERGKAGRDMNDALQRAQGKYIWSWEKPEAQSISQGLLDFDVAQRAGRTPLSDQLRNRAMASYMMGF